MEAIEMGPGPEIEVPKLLDEEQVRFFVDNGYLVVPDLMEPEELEERKDDLVAVCGEHG